MCDVCVLWHQLCCVFVVYVAVAVHESVRACLHVCTSLYRCCMRICTVDTSSLSAFMEMQAFMWVDAGVGALACLSLCVCVCASAAVALVHCVRRGYGILFLFLAASPSGAQPASVNCALQWDTAPLSLWRMPASGPRLALQLCVSECMCVSVCLCASLQLCELDLLCIFLFK